MSLKSVLSSLNGSYNSFAPNRSISVTSALAENLKFNLRFRFSLLGMITSLTRSSSLYSLAQQRYVDRKDARASNEEMSFKSSVAGSVAALGRQVSLLESITEKNTAMIHMIVNDLGYFKGQRRINFMNSTNLGGSTFFRAPVNKNTVKGKLDIINEQIQELKKKGVGGGKGEGLGESKLLQDMGKIAIAGGVGAYLAGALVEQFGVDGKGGSGKKIAQTIGALIGAGSIPATSKVIEYVLSKTLPVVSQIGRIYLGVKYVAPVALDVIGNSIERTKKRLTGISNETDSPNPYPPGSPQYLAEEEIRAFKRQGKQIFDTLLLPATVLLTAKYGSKGLKAIGRTGAFKSISAKATTAYRARFPTLSQTTKAARGSFAERMSRIQKERDVAAKYLAAQRSTTAAGGFGVLRGAIPLEIPPPGTPLKNQLRMERAAASAERRAGRGIINRAGRAVRGGAAYVAGLGVRSKGSERLGRLANAVKNSSTLRKLPIANLAYVVFEIGMMANAQEDYDRDKDYVAYKEAMTGSLTRLVNVVGVSTLGALIGGIVGTAAFPVPLVGTAAGALLGTGAAIAASFAFSGINGDSAVAEKLFGIMFEDKRLETQLTAGTYTPPNPQNVPNAPGATSTVAPGNENAPKSFRNNNPGNLRYYANLNKPGAVLENAIGSDTGSDGGFAIFANMQDGLNAMEKQLTLDTQTRGLTLAETISKYAPESDNNQTREYISYVSFNTGVAANSKVPPEKLADMMYYMILMEGGANRQETKTMANLVRNRESAAMVSGLTNVPESTIDTILNAPNNTAADQAILNYFISLGTVAQTLPSATETPAASEKTSDDTETKTKVEASLVMNKRTVEELTRVAQNVKVLQQKNSIDEQFPHVRPA